MREIIESGPIKIISGKGVKKMQKCCICGNEFQEMEQPKRLTVVLNFGELGNVAKSGMVCGKCNQSLTQVINIRTEEIGNVMLGALVKLITKKEDIPVEENKQTTNEMVKCNRCGNEFESKDITNVMDQGRVVKLCPKCNEEYTEEKKKLDEKKMTGRPKDEIK